MLREEMAALVESTLTRTTPGTAFTVGVLVLLAADGLHPSSKGARVKFSGAKRTVIDGPFAETKALIAGFWLWQVKSKEEAIEWVKRCPNPMPGESEIEIRQVFEAEDFGAAFTPEPQGASGAPAHENRATHKRREEIEIRRSGLGRLVARRPGASSLRAGFIFTLDNQCGRQQSAQVRKKTPQTLTMKTITCRFSIAAALAACVAGLVISCASVQSAKEVSVTLVQMSEPARAAVQKETSGGAVDKITREFEHGKTVYDVEATVGGRHLEYLIDAADGKILGTEVPVEFSQLPEPVRVAADKYFGTTTGLIAMKGVEFGATHYEIEGTRKGKRAEV